MGRTKNGLLRIEHSNWTVYDTSNSGLPENHIISLAIDSTNKLWIGTRYEGLVKYDGQGWTVYNDENSGIPDNCVFEIEVDSANNIWLGTMYGGLTKFDGTEWTSFTCTNSGMPGTYTTNIIIDHNHTKWANATSLYGGGVALYNENGLTTSVSEPIANKQTNQFSLFPNPVSNMLHIDIGTTYPEFHIRLLDMTGNVVRNISAKQSHLTINLTGLPSGMYMVFVTHNKTTLGAKKIIKF